MGDSRAASKMKGCFKYGCFGCLGLGGLLVVFFGIATVVSLNAGPENFERQQLTQEVPAPEPRDAELNAVTEEEFLAAVQAGEFDVSEPGRVIIDFSIGSFQVVPGPPDQPIHVEGDFDTSQFKLEQKYETYGQNGWTYKVSFGRKSIFNFFQIDHGREPRIKLVIPRNTPFTLKGNIKMGESELELGGLWLLDASLNMGMGDHRVSFDEPLPQPMRGFSMKTSMGSMRITRLGNASPEAVNVTQSMGELRLDLRGDWVGDTVVETRCKMGECGIIVPTGVDVDLKSATIMIGEKNVRGLQNLPPAEPGAPRMELSVRQSMGELRIDG